MATVYIGLGSNLGNREEHITQALHLLKQHPIKLIRSSSIIESDPVGGPVQGKYFNAVACLETDLSPQSLLECLLSVERSLGRVRKERNGPRTIDLDILLYENITLNLSDLKIPHPRMLERDFVMTPLKEIAPHITQESILCRL